jgi:hypothetical protein
MQLFGWTIRQWGIAINRLGHRPSTWEEVVNMREDWDRRYNTQPGEIQIIGGDYGADLEAAGNVFKLAVKAGVIHGR